ncbi:hypothetical protein [Methanobrevibacter sp.]|uniref:hypothetical protein n=1 Tax=Methanobrevibacter sp. TaxID=66852 RepID=UPI00388D536A
MEWNAVVNGIISFIIPGLGQGMNGYKNKAIIMIIIYVILRIGFYLLGLGIIGYIIIGIYSLYAAYDAYKTY